MKPSSPETNLRPDVMFSARNLKIARSANSVQYGIGATTYPQGSLI